MSATRITDAEVGKPVVDRDGDRIGIVSAVDRGTALVDPDPGLTDEIKAVLGWEDTDEETYPLHAGAIETITRDEIRVQSGQ